MGDPVVFLGPTLRRDDALQVLNARFLPPAKRGDVYRAAVNGVAAIGLVDGVFHTVASVWHKEVLWALDRGIPVYGAASMGALRAAELERYGMRGVGTVFELVRSGAVESDDEVAVAHAGAEFGYRPLSTALVDIRLTLGRALDHGVITAREFRLMLGRARAIYYPGRSFRSLLADCRHLLATPTRLERWLVDNQIHQKRADALELLAVMRDAVIGGGEPARPVFVPTVSWDELVRQIGRRGVPLTSDVELDALFDEVVLLGARADEVLKQAARRGGVAPRNAAACVRPSTREIEALKGAYLSTLDVSSSAARQQWLTENLLTEEELGDLVVEEARLPPLGESLDGTSFQALADALRELGLFPALLQRAEAKGALVDECSPQGVRDWALPSTESLVRWIVDVRGWQGSAAIVRNFPTAFLRAVRREYVYQTWLERRQTMAP
jgi:hypothetical protein